MGTFAGDSAGEENSLAMKKGLGFILSPWNHFGSGGRI